LIAIRWIVATIVERVARFRVRQERVGHHVRVPAIPLLEIGLLETLGVEGVNLIELQARFGLERGEGPHRLRGQRAPIDQEEDPPGDAGLHQTMDLVDHRQGLARAGRHGEEHLALAFADTLLQRRVGLDLVGAHPRVLGECQELGQLGIGVAVEHLGEGRGRVELRHAARAVQGIAHVVEADFLAVGGVEEGHAELALVARLLRDRPGVALGLREHVCWPFTLSAPKSWHFGSQIPGGSRWME